MSILVFIIGTGILLYPPVSKFYNDTHQSNMIMKYAENLDAMDNAAVQQMWDDAVAYNRNLFRAQLGDDLPDDTLTNYEEILHVADNGMMGYIDIPKISVHLPICHGTSDAVLQNSVGHLEWSSFPVGGENTHTVLTGHNGLRSARLFTDLEKMEIGDTFVLRIVGQLMTYEVDQILTVLPNEIDSLKIVSGEDLCTLTTCTPFGVNSHRLLVRGHRIENAVEDSIPLVDEAVEERAHVPLVRTLLFVLGSLLVLLIVLLRENVRELLKNYIDKRK